MQAAKKFLRGPKIYVSLRSCFACVAGLSKTNDASAGLAESITDHKSLNRVNRMKLDYKPVELLRRWGRRTVFVASLGALGVALFMSRESTAVRNATQAESLISDSAELESAAFDQAIQGAVADPLIAPPASEWTIVEVKAGQTLSEIFEQEGLSAEQWHAVLDLGRDARQLSRMAAGDRLELRKSGDQLEELRYRLDQLRNLQIRRAGEGFEALTFDVEVERQTRTVTGRIESSLFLAGQKAGLPVRVVMELADLFRYDVDFALDLREGDRFTVVIEELYTDGEKLRDGDMLAAEFINQGKVHRAVRFKDAEGRSAFYTPEGESLRKAFFRTPLDVVRISSPFNMRRRHPILNTIRAHKGVDYAAAAGTPIKATGDGRIAFMGSKGGYGRSVVLKHGSQYETLYAHLSRYQKGLSTGSKVSQGQIIGYVGSSGLATAPHLHYEFRVNGMHKNPVNIVMPRANPISRQQMAAFRKRTSPLIAQMETAKKPQVAQAPTEIVPAISAAALTY
ncbi:MAG: OapA family protein [Panacagrimonas sp.]